MISSNHALQTTGGYLYKYTPITLIGLFGAAGMAAFINNQTIGDGYQRRCDEIRADFAKVAEDYSKINWPDGYQKRAAAITVPINATEVGGFIGVQNMQCEVILK